MPARKTVKAEPAVEVEPTVCDCPCKNEDRSFEGTVRRRPVAAAIVAVLGFVLLLTIGSNIYRAGYIDGMFNTHNNHMQQMQGYGYPEYYYGTDVSTSDNGYSNGYGDGVTMMEKSQMHENMMGNGSSDLVFIDGIQSNNVDPGMMVNSGQ